MRRLITGALALALVGAAAAESIELVLVVDAGTKTVKRFDGYTGAYFGEFGKNRLVDPAGVAIVGNSAFITDNFNVSNSVIHEFNYHTGAFINTYKKPTGPYPWYTSAIHAGPGGNLYMLHNDTASGFNLAGGFSVFNPTTRQYVSDTGRLAGLKGANDFYIAGANLLNVTTAAGLVQFNTSTNAVSGPIAQGTGGAAALGGAVIVGNLGNNFLPFPGVQAPQMTSVFSAAFGHKTGYIAGGAAGGGSLIGLVNTDIPAVTGYIGVGLLTNAKGIAVRATPEPATLAAMGAGLALFARRRRVRR